jgi:4-amino-4-deoxy-L-arabinose transferase-like glycosyltransferase
VNSRQTIIFAILFIACLRLILVYFLPIMDNTEARYGEVSRLIIEYSDWITLHYNETTPFLGKPPLAFWFSAIGIYIFGVNEYGPRLPVLLVAIGIAVMIFRFVRCQLGAHIAWRTLLVLCGSIFFFLNSAVVQPDMILAFCTCWAMVSFWQWVNRPDDKLACWQLFAALGLGFMAKALAIGVYAIVPIAIWLTWKKKWLVLLNQSPWVTGIAISLVISVPWMIAVELKNPGFIQYFIVGENFQRFVEAGWGGDKFGSPKSQPFGMILVYCLLGLLPWSLFGIVLVWKKQRGLVYKKFNQHKEFYYYLLIWAVVPAAILFFNANYIFPYVIPISIPLSILIAAIFVDLKNSQFVPLSLVVPVAITALCIILINTASIHNHTQKFLVATYNEQCADRDCQLMYLDYYAYSADFYSRKKTKNGKMDLQSESTYITDKVDFIALREDARASLPDSIQLNFIKVGNFEPLILLMEQ